MKNKKDLTDDNMTGMPKPDFDINKNPFRDGDSLVDAVRAVLSGQPVTQEQAKELEKENPTALQDKRTQQEEQVNVQEAKLNVPSDLQPAPRSAGLVPDEKPAFFRKMEKKHNVKIKWVGSETPWGRAATFTGQEKDLVAYAKAHILEPHQAKKVNSLKDVQKMLESIQEATLVDINFDAGEYKRTGGEKSLKQHKLKIKIEKGKGSWGADKATLTGQDRDLIAYAKKHLGADGRNLKDVQKQLESIAEDASNDKSDDGTGLDKADPKAAKKKFKDRKDKDIDNDGDTDDSDEYLHKKRKAITKAVANEGNAFSKALKAAKKNGDKTFVVGGKTYSCEDVEEGKRIGGPSKKDYEKKHDAKIIATKMKRNKTWFGPKSVAQVSKMKFVTWKDLERSLPDHIPGKEIGALFREDASNDKSDDGKGLDKADPKAAKKKFADRKDKDIDNDGDTDDSDEYLHKKRKAITKAIAKEIKEKSKDYVLAVNPKDPKAKRGGGVQKVKKRDWPKLQKKGWILAEDRQAFIYIDPEEKCIEVDFGPAENLDDILVEGMMYERWSIPKMPDTNPKSGDNLVSWKHDFVDWLGELKPGAKFNISFADSGHVGDFPKAGARNERRYKFITKVIGQKVAEVMKALEKVEKIK